MNPRIQRLRADRAGDRAAFAKHVVVLEGHDPQAAPEPPELALVAWSLHHAYCAIASILARVARVLEGGVPESGDWHRDLLDGAFREIPEVRPAVLDRGLAPTLHDLRGFRHVVRQAYDTELDPAALARLRAGLRAAVPGVTRDLDAFDAWLQAVAAAG